MIFIKNKMRNLLVCPKCKGSLSYDKKQREYICVIDKLAYREQNGIPVLIIEEGRRVL